MKRVFAIMSALLFLAVSCTKEKEEVTPDPEEGDGIRVTLEASVFFTKADVMDDLSVTWSENDEIAVYDGAAVNRFKLVSGQGTKTATFEGELAEGTKSVQAIYPFAAAQIDGSGAFSFKLPGNQTIASGRKVDAGALVMTSGDTKLGETLKMSNNVSLLKFKVSGAGTVNFVSDGSGDGFAGPDSGRSISVNCPGAGEFFIAVAPGEYDGVKVFADGKLKEIAETITAEAGKQISVGDMSGGKDAAVIANASDLNAYLANPSKDAYLIADIDYSGTGAPAPAASFGKVLDGQGFSIINLKSSSALISTSTGTVKDIVMDESCSFTPGADDFAPFVINSNGALVNLTNNADITVGSTAATETNTMAVAGIAARSEGSISGCRNNGSIKFEAGTAAKALYLGGVAGMTKGALSECENTGDLEYKLTDAGGYKSTLIGGVAAYCGNKTSLCKNSGNLVMNAKYFSEAVPMEVYDGENSTCLVSVMMGGIIGGGAQKSATDSDFFAVDCSNSGNITFAVTDPMTAGCVTANSRHCFGGIVGDASGRVYGSVPGNTFNKGDISVSLTCPDSSFKYGAGTLTTYIGGIAGSNYFSKTQSEMSIDYCENFGKIDYLDQNTHTTTHTAAGIVGWPGTESSCTSTTTECVNNGDLNINSLAELRIGGVQGGSGRIDKCTNNGKITVTNASANAQIGGVAGFHSGGYALNAVKNYGDISCDSDLTNGGVGGLAGKFGNSAMTLCENSAVNCKITVKDAAYGGMVIGAFNGTTKAITCGTVAIKGSFNGETLTESNFKNYLHGALRYTEGKHIINATYGDAAGDDPSGGTGEPSVIKIMSFNIRHTGEAADTGELLWDNRKAAVLNMILSEMPDIIGMQECDKTQKDWLMEQIEGEGHDYYKHVYPGGNKCIFYKLSTMGYTSGTSGLFYHSDTPNVSSKWDGMSSSRVTAWIPLVDKNTGRKIYYFNTHTDASSGHDDIRKREAELNVAQIQKICPPNSVQIISGDMNTANPDCHAPFYPYFESSRTAPETDNYPTFNGFGKYDLTTGHYLDYIYVHGAERLIRHRTLVGENYGVKYVSDHWPVVLECEIK